MTFRPSLDLRQTLRCLLALFLFLSRGLDLFAAPPDTKAFFNDPPASAAISPSGEWLAFSTREDGKPFLYTRSIVTGKGMKRDMGAGAIDQLAFVNDAQVVYRQDREGKQLLYLLDVTGTGNNISLNFTPPEGAMASLVPAQPTPDLSGRLYFTLKSGSGPEALFALPVPKKGLVTKYDFSEVLSNPSSFVSWIFDRQGAVIGAVSNTGLNNTLYLLARDESARKESWNTAFTSNADVFPGFMGYGCPPGFLLANGYFAGNFSSAVLFDINTHAFGKPILTSKDSNISWNLFSPDLSRVDAFGTWAHPQKPIILSKEFKKVSETITSIIGSDEWTPQTCSKDYSGALIVQSSASRPPRFWQIDLKHKKGFVYSDLSASLGTTHLREVENLIIPARDGLQLEGFQLGLKESAQEAPVICWLGGGPFEGIHPEWAPIMQCLSSRGAVVVVVNYRGARGFGKAYFQAGISQADRGMINDVEDVLGYLATDVNFKGRKVILIGISFGGYLSVHALAQTQLKADGLVLINPALDPATVFQANVLKGAPAELVAYQEQKWFGNASSTGRSVMGDASALSVPLLLIQSLHDEKVSSDGAREFVHHVASAGTSAEFLALDDVHELTKNESWIAIASRVLDFVDQISRGDLRSASAK